MKGRCLSLLALFTGLALGCGGNDQTSAPTDDFSGKLSQRWSKSVVSYDFGTIEHGQVGHADVEIPLPSDLGPMIPLGFLRNCSCARHEFVIVGTNGKERIANERPDSVNAVQNGEKLVLRLSLHTSDLEAEDLARNMVRGHVVLQEDADSYRRELVPVQFSYAIETPIQVKPFAHLDLGDIARSARYHQTFELHSRRGAMRMGTPHCIEPEPGAPDHWRECTDLHAELTSGGDLYLLRISFAASAERSEGPMMMAVVIETDLPNAYEFRLPVSGKLVPDIQLSPPGKFFFGTVDFTKPSKQYMVSTDHHPDRTLDLVVQGIVDAAGKDISEHFDLHISPVPDDSRSQQLSLTYDGAIEPVQRRFTGTVYLGTGDDHDPVINLEIVAFHRPTHK